MTKNIQISAENRILTGMVIGILAFLVSFSISRLEVAAADEVNSYVIVIEDNADLLSLQEETLLKEKMEPITEYGNVTFLSIEKNNRSASQYAKKYYIDRYGTNSGTLFLVDMDNREIYIYNNGFISNVITDSYCDTITDNVYHYASKKQYYQCADEAYAQIFTLLSGRRIAQPMKYISNALMALIIAMVVLFQYVKMVTSPKKPSKSKLLKAIFKRCAVSNERAVLTHTTKRTVQSGGGGFGGGGGGGGFSGGGGSGGGHSF